MVSEALVATSHGEKWIGKKKFEENEHSVDLNEGPPGSVGFRGLKGNQKSARLQVLNHQVQAVGYLSGADADAIGSSELNSASGG
jgi:hypothetical protein